MMTNNLIFQVQRLIPGTTTWIQARDYEGDLYDDTASLSTGRLYLRLARESDSRQNYRLVSRTVSPWSVVTS